MKLKGKKKREFLARMERGRARRGRKAAAATTKKASRKRKREVVTVDGRPYVVGGEALKRKLTKYRRRVMAKRRSKGKAPATHRKGRRGHSKHHGKLHKFLPPRDVMVSTRSA